MNKKIIIREVGAREGLQIFPHVVALKEKQKLIELLSETGIAEIEVGALVRADRVPQMADTEELVRSLKDKPGIVYNALYLNQKGFELGEALPHIKNKAWILAATSNTFLKKNSNLTLDELYKSIPEWESLFAKYKKKPYAVLLSTAFGCHDEGSISIETLQNVLRQILEKFTVQIEEVCLADTIGAASPDKVKRTIEAVRKAAPYVEVSLHLHDTRGLGIANAYSGYQEGVRIFESSFGGVGGCPFVKNAAGNIATEELVLMLEEMGVATGVDLEKLILAVEYGDKVIGLPINSKFYSYSTLA